MVKMYFLSLTLIVVVQQEYVDHGVRSEYMSFFCSHRTDELSLILISQQQLPQSAPRTQQQQDKGGHQDRGAAGTKGSPWVRQNISWSGSDCQTIQQQRHYDRLCTLHDRNSHFDFKLKISSLHQQNLCLLWGGWRVQERQRNGESSNVSMI